jgi:hypothetical protein
MSVRKVVTRSGSHSRGLVPSIKNPVASAWESEHEKRLHQLLDLSPTVRTYTVQSTREQIMVDGEPAVYIPDVKVDFHDGSSAFFEVKPVLKCKTRHTAARLTAIRKHFQDTGRRFVLITDEWLAQQPRQANVVNLMYHRRELLLNMTEKIRLGRLIATQQPKTIGDLIALAGEAKAWLLLGLGIVGVDLELPMNEESTIFLDGGHRHANFYA